MQIITKDSLEFPDLLNAWNQSKCLGRYWKEGKPRAVCASSKFLIVSSGNGTTKFAVKHTRSIEESIQLAIQLLNREKKRGNEVELLVG